MEWPERTRSRNLVRVTGREVESYACGLLVCLCKLARVSIHSIALVHEALDLVSASLASESDPLKSPAYPPRSLRRIGFPRKELLRVRSDPFCTGCDSGGHRSRSRALSW